jgi:hypothetical protein
MNNRRRICLITAPTDEFHDMFHGISRYVSALSRTCGPRIGSGFLGIFRPVPKSVVSKSGFRKAARPSFGFVGALDSR